MNHPGSDQLDVRPTTVHIPQKGGRSCSREATTTSMSLRRRPSAATLMAIVSTLAIGSQASFAAGSSQSSRGAPDAVSSVEVTATDGSSVTIAWPASRDNDVAGYGVYVNGTQAGTQTPDQVKRWRDRDSLSYTLRALACGTGYTVGVDAFDRGDRHSPVTATTVSTSACPDAAPPSAPSGVHQVAATEKTVMLAWSVSADNVGVVEYGLYASGLRVATSSEASATLTNLACGTSYLIAIDAADAAGNRSAQANSFFRTSACPSSNRAPSTPTGLKVTASTATSVTLVWTAPGTMSRSAATDCTSPANAIPRRPPPAPTTPACSAGRPTRWASTRSTRPANARPSQSSPPRPPPALPLPLPLPLSSPRPAPRPSPRPAPRPRPSTSTTTQPSTGTTTPALDRHHGQARPDHDQALDRPRPASDGQAQ